MTLQIIGAGMAGLLAANMLRHKAPVVFERQSSLPNNHSAVLRFRSHIVGDVTGTEFKKVSIIKATLPWRNQIADSMAYAYKNTGTLRSDRSLPFDPIKAERYIAPPNFISQLAAGTSIKFGAESGFNQTMNTGPIISTIPMPALMELLNYDEDRSIFKSNHSVNICAKVKDCDAYVSLYVPDPDMPFSRVSITGDEIIAEVPWGQGVDQDIYTAAHVLGIHRHLITNVVVKRQLYAKIQPVADDVRKRFIAWASDNHNIYSLGRYACWRPTTLLDDLVQDIRLIERWINSGGHYTRKLHHNRKAS